MRRGALLLVGVLGLVLLSRPAVARAGSWNQWQWQAPPDDAKLRATIADMKRVAEAKPELVRVEATETSIVLTAADGVDEGMFVFPGKREGFNVSMARRGPYDDVISGRLAAAREHFTPDELMILRHSSSEDRRYLTGRYSPFGVGLWGLLYPLAIIFLLYLLLGRSRGGGASWGSYYLFWFAAPIAISFFSQYPLVLLLIPVALVARRWLPDPYLIFKHSGRIRSLEAQVQANPSNLTARRDLAVIWLERRRPLRAIPLVEEALAKDPESSELHFLRVALLHARRWEAAVEPLIEACRLDTRLRYGEPYLKAADALMALRRWDDADEALGHFLKVNGSSVEGWYKLALVRRARGDEKEAKQAFDEAKRAYRDSPAFHRRRYFGWYLRALVRG